MSACTSTYLETALHPNQRMTVIAQSLAVLEPRTARFDGIAFRGMSGALIAPALADALGKALIMVRKPRAVEDSHSWRVVEGTHCDRYIVVDDMVASGRTVAAIVCAIAEPDTQEPTPFTRYPLPVAVFTYRGYASNADANASGTELWSCNGEVTLPHHLYSLEEYGVRPRKETAVVTSREQTAVMISMKDIGRGAESLAQIYDATFTSGSMVAGARYSANPDNWSGKS